MSKYGPELLLEQLFEHHSGDWEWLMDSAPGDSKIEKLLFRALAVKADSGACEFDELLVARDADDEQRLKNETSHQASLRMIVRPQAEVGGRRVDFLISVFDYRGEPRWRSLIIECDGHNYHERTKEQAARDRRKDRAATLHGYDFFRFTGSEIWRDPWGCATQIGEWAAQGLP